MTDLRHAAVPSATGIDRVQELGDLLDLGVMSVDEQLNVIAWNDWLARATGKSRDAVVGRPLADLDLAVRPTTIAALRRAVDGAIVVMSHALHEYVIEARPPLGIPGFARMQQSARILPIVAPNGRASGATVFIEDVTERVARENALRSAAVEAERANEQKTSFFMAMSHELRTPIGAMSSYAQLLADEIFGPVNPEQLQHLRRITVVASHLEKIVNDLLGFARMDAGREELTLADVDARDLAEEALIAVAPLAGRKQLTMRTTYPDRALSLRTDAVKVRQILINLLGNAIKFTDHGGIALILEEVADGNSVAFTVADTGPGIRADDLERVFEPFTRLHRTGATGHAPEGTGLGLSVSRGIARLLGGDIRVSSELNVGSRFTAIIPRIASSR